MGKHVCVFSWYSLSFSYIQFQEPSLLSSHTLRLTEEHITEVDRHGLGLAVVVQRRLTKLAADTALLVATERKLPVDRVVCVDPDGTSLERVGDLDGSLEVGRVHGRGKTVCGVVSLLDDLLLGVELGDCADGAEDLFPLDLHILGHVGEDCGLDEIALVALALAAGLDGGAALLAVVDVATMR
jgi:hypothetical protein